MNAKKESEPVKKQPKRPPKPIPIISTVTILQDGTPRVSHTSGATWVAYTLEIHGSPHEIVLWVTGPHAEAIVPTAIAQMLTWRPDEEERKPVNPQGIEETARMRHATPCMTTKALEKDFEYARSLLKEYTCAGKEENRHDG